jgi:hypothetical protein
MSAWTLGLAESENFVMSSLAFIVFVISYFLLQKTSMSSTDLTTAAKTPKVFN